MSITNNTLCTILLKTPNPQHTQSMLTHKTAIMKRNHQLKAGFIRLTAEEVSFQSPLASAEAASATGQSVSVLFRFSSSTWAGSFDTAPKDTALKDRALLSTRAKYQPPHPRSKDYTPSLLIWFPFSTHPDFWPFSPSVRQAH